MKYLSVFIQLLLLVIIPATILAQPGPGKDSLKWRQAMVDSLQRQSVPYAQLKTKYNSMRPKINTATFSEGTITLDNGSIITYQTSDNARTRVLLSRIFKMSPVDFLIGLRGIEGRISIPTAPSTWVKKEDIPQLLKLSTVDAMSPQIKQKIMATPRHKVPLQQDSVYFKTPVGINALDLIGSYLSGIFPSITPSYESVKTWYDSGRPREEYRFEPFTPVIRDPKLPHQPVPVMRSKP